MLFQTSATSFLRVESDLETAIISHLRAWSTVIGGNMIEAPNALKKGAYSFTSISSPYLRLFFPLFNGEHTDTVIGFYQTDYANRMVQDYSRYWMPSDFDSLPFAYASEQCIELSSSSSLSS